MIKLYGTLCGGTKGMVGQESEVGCVGTCVPSLNRMVKADLMEKVKSEQTLGRGKGSNCKLFMERMFQIGEHVQGPQVGGAGQV